MAYIYEKALRDRIYGILYDMNKSASQKRAEIESFLLQGMADELDGPKMNPYDSAEYAMKFATYPWAKRFDTNFNDLTTLLNEKYGIGFKSGDPPADNGPEPASPQPSSGPDPIAVASGYSPSDEIPLRESIKAGLAKLFGSKAATAVKGMKLGEKAFKASDAVFNAAGKVKRGVANTASSVAQAARYAQPVTKWAGFLIMILILALAIFVSGVAGAYIVMGVPIWLTVLVLLFMFSSQFRTEFRTPEGILFGITMLFHVVIITRLQQISVTPFIITIILLYTIVAVIYAITQSDKRTLGVMMTILTVFAYTLPFILGYFGVNEVFQEFVSFLVMFFPIWPLYLLERLKSDYPEGWASRTLLWYKILLFLVLIIWFWSVITIYLPSMPSITGSGDVSGKASTFIERMREQITGGIGRTGTTVKQITDPGSYYKGRIEDTEKDKEIGVAIENLRPQDREVNNETEIFVFGTVKAKSFTGQPSIAIEPSCLIDKKGAPQGSVEPAILDVLHGTGQSFECRFPPLATGSYRVLAAATFPFETWSYIPYTFVDEERARNLARQGLDINDELDIPEEPLAIYSRGPVIVTMGGTSQPILVRPEQTPILQPGTRIGITIDPGWEGKLQRVESIQLKLPDPFILGSKQCGDRNVTTIERDIEDPAYTTYTFQNTNYGPLTTWTSITCPLNISTTQRDAAAELVANDKAVRSFIAVVQYRYTIEETTSVTVR